VIIGNPPYQLDIGNTGGNISKSSAIYHLFVDKAIELKPKYITMIVPSRWMTNTADGVPKKWVIDMIKGNTIKEIHDFENADNLFNGVGIAGGVNYFLLQPDYDGECNYSFHTASNDVYNRIGKLDPFNIQAVIRNPNNFSIIEKIVSIEGDYFNNNKNFSSIMSPKDFFSSREKLTTSWRGYKKTKDDDFNIKYYVSKSTNGVDHGWIKYSQIARNHKSMVLNKVLIGAGYGGGPKDKKVLNNPIYSEPNSVCSQTYIVAGYDEKKHNFTKEECFNIISYINTRFFRFMVKVKKFDQSAARGVYQFVPLQDFSKPWTDEELYKKYKLTQEEIDYIEDNIDPMD